MAAGLLAAASWAQAQVEGEAWRAPAPGPATLPAPTHTPTSASTASPGQPPSRNGATLPSAVLEALRANGVPPHAVSMLVLPADGGPARLDHHGEVVRQPASVMKLFTTGAALAALGPAFTWRTDAALGGPLLPDGTLRGPLYLRGSGDPSLVLENVWLMMSRWRAAGLRHIEGGIVVDRRAFELPPHDPGAFDGAALKPYNAGPDALLLNHQAITIRLTPDAARPDQVRVSMEPELEGVRLDNRLSLKRGMACDGGWRERLALDMARQQEGDRPNSCCREHHGHGSNSSNSDAASTPGTPGGQDNWVVRLQGIYPEGCHAREWPLLWQGDGPGDHARRLLSQTWLDLGGAMGPAGGATILPGMWPDKANVWQSWTSPPLVKVVQDINKFSNNVMARQLFLSLAPLPGPATLDKARAAVAAQVRAATRDASGLSPCDGDGLALDNGSGLSRLERSTGWCLGRWIQAMWASPVMPEFLASMPVTGLDGTARRLTGTSGRAHIKTGSLDSVMSIAGVVLGDSGRRHVVVAMVNHPNAPAARPALDALLGWVMRDRDAAAAGP